MVANILVVDDDELLRWSVRDCLEREGYNVTAVENAAGARKKRAEGSYDLVLLDFMLPDTDGLELLREWHLEAPELPVVMMTAHSTVEHAVEAMRSGATDYLSKPFEDQDMLLRVSKVLEMTRLKSQVRRLERAERKRFSLKNVVGDAPGLEQVLRVIERVIQSGETTVLIHGESGTGKDVLARALHFEGPRGSGPFMNITCTALPESLLESELFGHEKGAFTDARSQKKGLFELANGGTIFLDEIGDMSPHLQSKLLRFLEEKTFRRVGGNADIRVNARVVAATNKDLKALVSKGTFREDLYFRLKVIPIHLPALRERKEDIPLLVDHFLALFNEEFKKQVKGATPAFLKQLKNYHWPGNIRELKNTIERAMILGSGECLDADDLPMELLDEPGSPALDSEDPVKLTLRGVNLETIERSLVKQALDLANQNQVRAARLLGLSRDQLRYRKEKFGFGSKRERASS